MKTQKYTAGDYIYTDYLSLYLCTNKAIYVQFMKKGEAKLMPSKIILSWSASKRLIHNFRFAIEIVTEADIVAKVMGNVKVLT